MNSCVLALTVITQPELRYTPDNQTPVTKFTGQFSGYKEDEPPRAIEVTAWGDLAQRVQQEYQQGDCVIVEGALRMDTSDRPEGFKEKVATLNAQRVHLMSQEAGVGDRIAPAPQPKSTPNYAPTTSKQAKAKPVAAGVAEDLVDYDEIPF